jgi:hypothetical protein
VSTEAYSRCEGFDDLVDDTGPAWLTGAPEISVLHDDPNVGSRPFGERRIEVLRRVELWSALKLSLLLYSCVLVVFLAGGAGLWELGRRAGAIDGLENLIEDLGVYAKDSFHFQGEKIFKISAVVGPILVVLGSFVTVLGVAVFNVAARLTGGLAVTVSEGDDLGRRRRRAERLGA